ncbi:hypothetical protein AB8B21_18000 [Tardiphaga sp. 866_E4_N2_1]|uniref:hypothetical protein n=1 Tax=Tardiphaga sp. 866_E4_N2_1 TaxID=3240767 RepID=UPI003F201AC8
MYVNATTGALFRSQNASNSAGVWAARCAEARNATGGQRHRYRKKYIAQTNATFIANANIANGTIQRSGRSGFPPPSSVGAGIKSGTIGLRSFA